MITMQTKDPMTLDEAIARVTAAGFTVKDRRPYGVFVYSPGGTRLIFLQDCHPYFEPLCAPDGTVLIKHQGRHPELFAVDTDFSDDAPSAPIIRPIGNGTALLKDDCSNLMR